ncbi:YfhH family protein [Planococcus sp. N028]|uniref:YfhH family protein n=1 Tax=Planococcus shixiaomingii TaxID=3058393 RepID=A0ABT8N749_9BACL|nr:MULTISPECIES: YfhH family protein [unclassified Planococcus (in: firmicutes)]MDN7243693.1 YfhH family protein [Planococcus sp. N028]WKA55830.1 YfhH family protein [Planococcus sp. N022]
MTEHKRYSQMTEQELRAEIARLKEKARKAEQLGIVNEFAVLERKAIMAAAYLMDPNDFQKGEVYRIEGDPNMYFKIDYFNGRFAWGYRLGGERHLEALPISMLRPLKEGK